MVHVPAFAEEMNKSRRMVAAQASELVARGFGVVIVDLFGTGDSAGEFRETTWDGWIDDLRAVTAWVRWLGVPRVTLWGLRLGCLLAVDYVRRYPRDVWDLLLWQPLTSGDQALRQFLRLRVAAGMMGGARESTEDLLRKLASGLVAEVAGYELNGTLARGIRSASLDTLMPAADTPVAWLEVGASSGEGLSPASRRLVDRWRAGGVTVIAENVAGEPFWMTQEIVLAPELLAATARCLSTPPAEPVG